MNEPRIVLVTGASRGIGRAVALAAAREGWRVVALARSQNALVALDDEIRAMGHDGAVLVPGDVKDGDSLDRLGAQLHERFGRLDGLAACAGVLGELIPAHQATPALFAEVLSVNLIANHRLIRSLHPLLRASPAGRAVFLSSGAAKSARAYWGPYAASKAGLDALVLSYAAETAITPIRVNLLDPGAVATTMRAKAFPGEDPKTLPTPQDVAPHIVRMLRADYAETRLRLRYDAEQGCALPA